MHELPQELLLQNEEKLEDGGKRAMVQMKGAPERILALCDQYAIDDAVQALDADMCEEIEDGGSSSNQPPVPAGAQRLIGCRCDCGGLRAREENAHLRRARGGWARC